MGRSRYKITNPQAPHFITLAVLHWIPVFTRPETVNILPESQKFLSAEGLKVYAYVIPENHAHFIVQSLALNRGLQAMVRQICAPTRCVGARVKRNCVIKYRIGLKAC